jgi:hypothetical protein
MGRSMKFSVLVAAGVMAAAGSSAAADVVGTWQFMQITANNAGNIGVGGRISMDLISVDDDPNQALFRFYWNEDNGGSSTITDIYFDDGTLLGIASFGGSAGVSFGPGNNNGAPPGANGNEWNWDEGEDSQNFAADPNTPQGMANGVQFGENVDILFNLQDDLTVDDVLAAINLAFTDLHNDLDGGLRVGLHVQGLVGGSSEGFIMVPVPPAAWAGLASLGGVCGLGYVRRRSFRA